MDKITQGEHVEESRLRMETQEESQLQSGKRRRISSRKQRISSQKYATICSGEHGDIEGKGIENAKTYKVFNRI